MEDEPGFLQALLNAIMRDDVKFGPKGAPRSGGPKMMGLEKTRGVAGNPAYRKTNEENMLALGEEY